jgi:hypothetical protein
MTIKHSFSFLTYPGKHKPDEPIAPGTAIPNSEGKLARMLSDIFANAGRDCLIPIMFVSPGESQENEVRSDLIALVKKPSVAAAAVLARRLQLATTGTSGMGLLFISIGAEGQGTRIVISRFPADEGVVAERTAGALTVEFVEQVFLKSAHSYKAVTYLYEARPNDLWDGHAVDRQLNHGLKAMADYWIVDFLKSDLKTTAAAGTKRLALALRAAVESSSDIGTKREITSAVQLASNMTQRALTIEDFCKQFHFSPETTAAISRQVKPVRLLSEKFRFDKTEFSTHIAYKQIELDNGAVLSAPAERFDKCFTAVNKKDTTTYTTSGAVVDERLRTRK